MGKIGRWLTDSNGGASCKITLGNGDTIIVKHDKSVARTDGSVIIERLKLMGFASDRVFACNLESDQGKTALRFLTREAPERNQDATPLGAFVKYVQSCQTVDEVKNRCRSLMATR